MRTAGGGQKVSTRTTDCWKLVLSGQCLVHLHQFGHTFGFTVEFAPEAIGLHNCYVVGAVGLAWLRGRKGRQGCYQDMDLTNQRQ